MNKYTLLTNDSIDYKGRILYRIKALKSFGLIKKGDLGGYIESYTNLSQEGNCWVNGNAKVYDNGQLNDDASICEFAEVYDNAKLYESAKMFGSSKAYCNSIIRGDATIYGKARIYGFALVAGTTFIGDHAKIHDYAVIDDKAGVLDHAEILGDAKVLGDATISHDAVIKSNRDYVVFKNWWSSGRYFTWTRSNNKYLVGCFYGTGEELIEKAYKDSKESGIEYEKIVKYVNSIL